MAVGDSTIRIHFLCRVFNDAVVIVTPLLMGASQMVEGLVFVKGLLLEWPFDAQQPFEGQQRRGGTLCSVFFPVKK